MCDMAKIFLFILVILLPAMTQGFICRMELFSSDFLLEYVLVAENIQPKANNDASCLSNILA